MALKRRKKILGLTLVETLIAVVIMSTTAIGVLGSFSYGFRFMLRAARKIEGINYGRKAVERYRAIWLADPDDTRLALTTAPSDITLAVADLNGDGTADTNAKVYLEITPWSDAVSKQIKVRTEWIRP